MSMTFSSVNVGLTYMNSLAQDASANKLQSKQKAALVASE